MEEQKQPNKEGTLKPEEGEKTVLLPEAEEKKPKRKILVSGEEYESLKEKAKQAEEYLDRLLRLQAEFDNAKKRLEKEKIEFIRFANEGIICELLGIIDDFERAIEATKEKEDFKSLFQGVQIILGHLQELIKKKGVTQIDSVGKIFDPVRHEAIMQIESEEHPDNIVVEEVRKGYELNGRVIRPAVVKVAKKPEAREEKPEDNC